MDTAGQFPSEAALAVARTWLKRWWPGGRFDDAVGASLGGLLEDFAPAPSPVTAPTTASCEGPRGGCGNTACFYPECLIRGCDGPDPVTATDSRPQHMPDAELAKHIGRHEDCWHCDEIDQRARRDGTRAFAWVRDQQAVTATDAGDVDEAARRASEWIESGRADEAFRATEPAARAAIERLRAAEKYQPAPPEAAKPATFEQLVARVGTVESTALASAESPPEAAKAPGHDARTVPSWREARYVAQLARNGAIPGHLADRLVAYIDNAADKEARDKAPPSVGGLRERARELLLRHEKANKRPTEIFDEDVDRLIALLETVAREARAEAMSDEGVDLVLEWRTAKYAERAIKTLLEAEQNYRQNARLGLNRTGHPDWSAQADAHAVAARLLRALAGGGK